MRWIACNFAATNPAAAPPAARMGHIAVGVDARESWGDEIVVVHGGLSEGKYALGDVVIFQAEGDTWSRPDIPSDGPHARAFHCAAVVSSKVYMFGGHVWVKEKKGLQKFNDLWCLNTVRLRAVRTSNPCKRSLFCHEKRPHEANLLIADVTTAIHCSLICKQRSSGQQAYPSCLGLTQSFAGQLGMEPC